MDSLIRYINTHTGKVGFFTKSSAADIKILGWYPQEIRKPLPKMTTVVNQQPTVEVQSPSNSGEQSQKESTIVNKK